VRKEVICNEYNEKMKVFFDLESIEASCMRTTNVGMFKIAQ